MAGNPLSDKDAIDLLMSQVESRNEEIILRRRAMNKAVNMLKAGDCTAFDVINVLVERM